MTVEERSRLELEEELSTERQRAARHESAAIDTIRRVLGGTVIAEEGS